MSAWDPPRDRHERRHPLLVPCKEVRLGWGFPATWEGWAVFAVYGLLVVGAVPYVDFARHALGFATYWVLLTAGLLVVCWLKGEPLRWRWGK